MHVEGSSIVFSMGVKIKGSKKDVHEAVEVERGWYVTLSRTHHIVEAPVAEGTVEVTLDTVDDQRCTY